MDKTYSEYVIAKARESEQFRFLSDPNELKFVALPIHAFKMNQNDAVVKLFKLRETQKDEYKIVKLTTTVSDVNVVINE